MNRREMLKQTGLMGTGLVLGGVIPFPLESFTVGRSQR